MKVLFTFRATAFLSSPRYHLEAQMGERLFEVQWPGLAAYIVNKYSNAIAVEEYGFGYEADLPENAILALQYVLHRRAPPTTEELDEIVASGTTEIHILRKKLNVYSREMSMEDLFLKDAEGKSLNLCFRDFPKLILYSNDGAGIRIEFNVENVEPEFLRRALNGELTDTETELLKGVSLLQGNTQTKYMQLLSHGLLTKDSLAQALYRSACLAKKKDVWLPLVDWLKSSGFSRKADEVIAKKTLCA